MKRQVLHRCFIFTVVPVEGWWHSHPYGPPLGHPTAASSSGVTRGKVLLLATSTSLTAEMNNLLSWEAGQGGAAFTPHLDNHMHHGETRTGQGPFPRAVMPEASTQQQNILLHHKSLGNINKQLHLLTSLPPKSRRPPPHSSWDAASRGAHAAHRIVPGSNRY